MYSFFLLNLLKGEKLNYTFNVFLSNKQQMIGELVSAELSLLMTK